MVPLFFTYTGDTESEILPFITSHIQRLLHIYTKTFITEERDGYIEICPVYQDSYIMIAQYQKAYLYLDTDKYKDYGFISDDLLVWEVLTGFPFPSVSRVDNLAVYDLSIKRNMIKEKLDNDLEEIRARVSQLHNSGYLAIADDSQIPTQRDLLEEITVALGMGMREGDGYCVLETPNALLYEPVIRKLLQSIFLDIVPTFRDRDGAVYKSFSYPEYVSVSDRVPPVEVVSGDGEVIRLSIGKSDHVLTGGVSVEEVRDNLDKFVTKWGSYMWNTHGVVSVNLFKKGVYLTAPGDSSVDKLTL